MVRLHQILVIMIELCTKKCMAAITVLLLMVTILVLIVENEVYSSDSFHTLAASSHWIEDNITKQCWLHEHFHIKKDCSYCSEFEKKSNTHYCIETGYKMLVQCEKSGSKWKSCRRPKDRHRDKRNFWLFEGGTLVLGLLALAVVQVRRKNLDKCLMDKINRQIASGV